MAIPAVVQSGYFTDQNAAGTMTVTAGSATSAANQVFVSVTMQNSSQNLSLTAANLSGGGWTMVLGPLQDAGTGADMISYLFQKGGGDTAFTFSGYGNLGSIAFVEISNFNSSNIYHGPCSSYADSSGDNSVPGTVVLPIVAPLVTPAITVVFLFMHWNPTTWSASPSGVTYLQTAPGTGQFHTGAVLLVNAATTGSFTTISFLDEGNSQGSLPVFIQLNANGTPTGGGTGGGGGSGGVTTGNPSVINPPTVGAVSSQSPNDQILDGHLLIGA